jgi:O-antigen ligase
VGALVVYPAFVEWRLVNLTGSASAAAFEVMARSDEGRLAGVLAGLPLFLSSPIVGVGFGQYLAASVEVFGSQAVLGAHNWYVYVLAEQGVVGITLWLIVLVAVVAELRNRPSAPRRVGFAVFSSLAVASLFLEAPTSFQTVALPSLFLVAALVSDWGPPRDGEDGAGTLIAATTDSRLSSTL